MVKFEAEYLPAFAGVVVGAVLALLAATFLPQARKLSHWDRRATIPLLLAAAGAHLALLPRVELLRIVPFSLYGIVLVLTVAFAFAGVSGWRVAAVVFPLGSILGYFYFGAVAHEVDVVGLIVKLLEVAAIAAAVRGALAARRATGWTVT
jgi:hypothetical protein